MGGSEADSAGFGEGGEQRGDFEGHLPRDNLPPGERGRQALSNDISWLDARVVRELEIVRERFRMRRYGRMVLEGVVATAGASYD